MKHALQFNLNANGYRASSLENRKLLNKICRIIGMWINSIKMLLLDECSFIAFSFGRIPKFQATVQFRFSRTISSEVVQNHLNMANVEISNPVRSIENSNLNELWKQHKFSEQ